MWQTTGVRDEETSLIIFIIFCSHQMGTRTYESGEISYMEMEINTYVNTLTNANISHKSFNYHQYIIYKGLH